jgi:Transglutaminase-like superfamily
MFIRGLLTVEAVLALMLAWILVFLLPPRWLPLLGCFKRSGGMMTGVAPDPAVLARARGVAWRIDRTGARLPWHSTCLVLAMAGMLLLRRRGIAGWAIRFGVRKRQERLDAHAWLLLGPTILLGGNEADNGFVPLADMTGPPQA